MINIAGASEGRIAPFIAESRQEKDGQCLIVVPTLNRARRLQSDLSFFNGNEPIYILPPEEDRAMVYEAKSNDSLLERMRVLRAVTSGECCTVIAPVTGAVKRLPPKETFTANIIELQMGQDVDLSELRNRLSLMGYERVSMIEARGEYSMRGGIIVIRGRILTESSSLIRKSTPSEPSILKPSARLRISAVSPFISVPRSPEIRNSSQRHPDAFREPTIGLRRRFALENPPRKAKHVRQNF